MFYGSLLIRNRIKRKSVRRTEVVSLVGRPAGLGRSQGLGTASQLGTEPSHPLDFWLVLPPPLGFLGSSDSKESTCNAGDTGSIPGLGRPCGGGHGNPLQCSCLENAMDKGAWRATVHSKESDMTEQLSMHQCTLPRPQYFYRVVTLRCRLRPGFDLGSRGPGRSSFRYIPG